MKHTRYFTEQVIRKRPYIKQEWCDHVAEHPLKKENQPDGRIRCWALIPEFGNRALRVVLLADGQTIHNAFFDRDFKVD